MQGWTTASTDHLDQYNDIDVALDTWPYNGTTTTCEALLMGVPVVTLAGKDLSPGRSASRVGSTVLKAAGFPELVAASEPEYVDIAAGLLRRSVDGERAARRAAFLNSTMCNGQAYGCRLGEALWSLRQGATA